MVDRDISLRAAEYVRRYRNEQGDASRTTRRKHRYPMIVYFLDGDFGSKEDDFDFAACCETVQNTARAFWVNHETVAYATIKDGDYNETVAEVCRKALKDDTTESAATVSVSIVIKSYDGDCERIGGLIEETIANLQFRVGSNIDFSIFILVSEDDPDEVRLFKKQFNYIQELMEDEKMKRCPVRAFVIGNMLSESNHQINKAQMFDSLASNIILINNSDTVSSVTLNDFFAPRKITLTGFSKADIPLETVYIIGFDVFSDTVMNFFKRGQKEIVPEYSFSVEKDILCDYAGALKVNAARYAGASKHLLRKKSLVAGVYSFEQINNAEFYGNLEKYIDINMERDRIAVPDEQAICEALDKYLLNYFEDYGLENAEKLLQTIVVKERTNMQSPMIDPLARQFPYDPNNTSCLMEVIGAVIQSKINKLTTAAREYIVKHIENSNTNIIQIIARTMSSIQEATERCKNESVIMDNDMSAELVKRYEGAVYNKSDEIEDAIRRHAMSFSFNNSEALEESIFLYYEDRIVQSVLFGKMNNYQDDIDNMTYEQARTWINSQESKADLSLRLTNKSVDSKIIFLTNMDPNTDRNSKMNNVMLYLKEQNYSILPVSGVPAFRCLKYRTGLSPTDLFTFQNVK